MELQDIYKLHNAVRFLRRTDCVLVSHLGNGAWFKVTPWVEDVLSKLGTEPLEKYIASVAKTYGRPAEEIQRFFETLDQSGIVVSAAAEVSKGQPATPGPGSVVWRANRKGSPDGLFHGQAAMQFIDALVLDGVQRIILEGDWLAREDVSDIVSLAQMVSGFVMLAADDKVFSPESSARLENVPEMVEVWATDACCSECAPLASTRQALAALKENHFYALRVHVPFSDLRTVGLNSVFQALDPIEIGLNLPSVLPSDRDALCVAGQLGERLIEPDEVVALFKEYLAHEISTFNFFNLQWFYDRSLKRTRCACGAARNFASVEADGGVYPCMSLIADGTRMGTWTPGKGLGEAIAESPILRDLRRRDVDNIPGCQDCDVRYFCGGGCPANALRAGDILGKDPLCPVYQRLLGVAVDVWRDDRVLEDNFAALVAAL